jgi:hypothetical protein
MKIVERMSGAAMATVDFEITVHSVGMARFGDFPPDNIDDILDRLRSRNKVEEVYDDSADRERARLREVRRLEHVRKRKVKRAKKLLRISIPSTELKYDEEIVEYDGLRRISQEKYLEFVALVDEEKADRLRNRIANKEELRKRKARMAKLQAAQKERALLLAEERARKWGVNAISTDVARDTSTANRLADLLRQAGLFSQLKKMANRIKALIVKPHDSDGELSNEEEETVDGSAAAIESGPDSRPWRERARFWVTAKTNGTLLSLGLKNKKVDSTAILASMRDPDEYSDSDSD